MRIDRVKLITEMARRDLTTVSLSQETGISRNTLTMIRSGKSCSEETAGKIARALGVKLKDILERR